jgi:hypothetical protein
VKFFGRAKGISGEGAGNLFLRAFYNGNLVAKTYTSESDYNWNTLVYIPAGNFSFFFEVPLDYTPQMNLSIITEKAGVYPRKEHIISGFGQVFDTDVAVLNLSAPEPIIVGNNNFSVTVANTGTLASEVQVNVLYTPINWQGNEFWEGYRKNISNSVVLLQPHEVKTINFTAQIDGPPNL